MTDETALALFPSATGFWEIPDESAPLEAFGVVVMGGIAWAFDREFPRPILLDELRNRGAFPCKPSDAVELIPAELIPKI